MFEKIPDLTSYRIDEAEKILKENGINFTLKKTTPILREKHKQNEVSTRQCRVLKQIEHENMVVLIFAEEAS
ncbi:MAG: PASTA domain-containing protein [Bacillota bacterium]|nr:PASTA domain-containing protein [Bacillota bacterium]